MIPARYAGYEKTATLACANYAPIWGDKAANLEKMKRMMVEAAIQGVGIIAFPELALSGYQCSEDFTMHGELAETIPGPATEELAALAREHDIYAIVGMPERDPDDARILYNSCAVIAPEGVLGAYRKVHIAPPPIFTETECFTAGDEVPVFETRYGPIGVQICADFWVYPELSRILMLKGARIIFNSAGSMDAPGRPYYLQQMTGARAVENMVYTASANFIGKDRTNTYYGYSTIAGPAFPRFVHIFAQAADKEEIVSATVNFAQLHRFRELIDIAGLRRSRLMVEEFSALLEMEERGADVKPMRGRGTSG